MPKPILHTALFHLPHQLSSVLAHSDGNLHLLGAHHSGAFAVKTYSKLITLKLWVQGLPLAIKVAVLSSILLAPIALLSILFVSPTSTSFSYAGQNCFSNFIVLPNLAKPNNSANFSITKSTSFSVGGYPLLSRESCVHINSTPENTSSQTLTLTALGFLDKKVQIDTPELPRLLPKSDLTQPLSPVDGLNFELDKPDETFSYKLAVKERVADCSVENSLVNCPLKEFGLDQGSTHEATVAQVFNDYEEVIISEKIKLRDPVIFTESSVVNEQIIYGTLNELTLTANKNLSKSGNVTLTNGDKEIPISSEVSENQIKIKIEEQLNRESGFTLKISDSEAVDGAYLPQEFAINFTTSGGPKVKSHNIANYDVSASKTFVLTFDSNVYASQDLNKIISISSSGSPVSAYISAEANRIYINPTSSLNACTDYNIAIAQGLLNEHGITGNTSWTHGFRTTCKQIFSIGSSVQGRALTAYRFGSGSTRILFVGGMHGNERSSYRTLIAFVDELERRYNEIPADKTIVIVPDINPDGYAHQTRTNANGIDLNRNFPSNDWTTGVHMPGGIFLENGGGATPLDQPESSALASYINSFGPRLVLTYHAVASTVISNGASDSYSIASTYSSHSGFAHYTHSQEDGVFEYPTTGEFETWLADKKEISTLLVELATMSSNELYSQRSAMWAMLGI